jgi:hypothetical protein
MIGTAAGTIANPRGNHESLALSLLVCAFALGSITAPALAQSKSACEAKADANVDKCLRDAWAAKVDDMKDKNGQAYRGAVRANAINKCVKEG